jgi:hypothetical protein
MKTPADVLSEAADLIELGWCRGAEARDEAGQPIDPASPQAVEWSVSGAISRASEGLAVLRLAAVKALASDLKGRSIESWNDDTGGSPGIHKALLIAAVRMAAFSASVG